MRVALVTDRPDHPVLARMVGELRTRNPVTLIAAVDGCEPAELAAKEARALADVYLLKSHTPNALELARRLELSGALVVNSWASTLACQDRVLMSRRLAEAGVPCPRTWSLASLAEARRLVPRLGFPLIVKSRFSRRGDLVTRVRTADDLEVLMPQWEREPVVVQEYADNDGWDVKLWVVGTRAFAARRRSPLIPGAGREAFPIPEGELPRAWATAAARVGREFDLSLYGIDILLTESGPLIVDVNAFPGYRGVPGAATVLAAFTEELVAGREGQRRNASIPVAPGGEIWAALETAAQQRLGVTRRLVHARPEPVRHRAGSRRVLRYLLTLEGGVTLTVLGTLYADGLQAVAVDAITRRLHAEQASGDQPPVLPRPLGVAEGAGLALSAVADGGDGPFETGHQVLLPRRRSRDAGLQVPVDALTAAAVALARLHSSSVAIREGLGVVRSSVREAERARGHGALLSAFVPALAPRITAVAEVLAARLAAAGCEAAVPCHGGFTPSRLLYGSTGRIVITGFDGLCLADAALDAGCFLANLRPLSIWRGRVETETWFAFAAALFMTAYSDGMVRRGTAPSLVEAARRRVPLYEAASLLEIAARRPQRLNSPRHAELSAMLDEIVDCLALRARAA